MNSLLDISQLSLRLGNIRKKGTSSVSFQPMLGQEVFNDSYFDSKMTCLENIFSVYELHPDNLELLPDWNVYAYDESTQNFSALEGVLFFCSSTIIKIEENYTYNLVVLPYFFTSMKKFQYADEVAIQYSDNISEARKMVMLDMKISSIENNVEPHSIVLIDGPLVAGNISTYVIAMDEKLRSRDCIPLYFVKNSNSRIVIDNYADLSGSYNSDFHWASKFLKGYSRTSFFRYTDLRNSRNSKVLSYVRTVAQIPTRIEMHRKTYEKYSDIIPSIMDLLSYYFVVQGDGRNPQVRPIAIAEIYAREGLKVLNLPSLFHSFGFTPTLNQMRFG